MKKFILKITLFLAIFTLIDIIYGKTCEYLRKNAHGGNTYIDNLICDSIQHDILIFGSSRAHVQYDPVIIADSLGMDCFNCGYNGMGIIYHYGRYKIITQRYHPKVIIYDILPVLDMMIRDDNIIFINNLRPHYDQAGVDSIFWKIDSTEKIKMYSNTYKYHALLRGLFGDYKSHHYSKLGYEPSISQMQNEEIIQEKTDYQIDELKMFYLESFIKDCIASHTKLIFTASPRYGYDETGNAFDPLLSLCHKYNIPFLNHYTDKRFTHNKEYYHDATHFCKKGSTLYTKDLIKELRIIIHDNRENIH